MAEVDAALGLCSGILVQNSVCTLTSHHWLSYPGCSPSGLKCWNSTREHHHDQIHFISVCVLYLPYEYYSDVRTRYVHTLYAFAVYSNRVRTDGW